MKKNIVLVYDNTVNVDSCLKDLVGLDNFSNMIFLKKTFKEHMIDCIKDSFSISLFEINKKDDLNKVCEQLLQLSNNFIVLYIYSNSVVFNSDKFNILLNKLLFSKENYSLVSNLLNGYIFFKLNDFIKLSPKILQNTDNNLNFPTIDVGNCIRNVNNTDDFLRYITKSLDTRFFNNLSSSEFTITKSSTNIKKIFAEYKYYWLIPDEMKRWFIMPYDYTEENGIASYTMEKINFTDVALLFVNNFLNLKEFDDLLKLIFQFIKERNEKKVNSKLSQSIFDDLYINKLKKRIEDLKKLKQYEIIENEIKFGTKFKNIDEIVEKYLKLLNKITSRNNIKKELVIGHGDLCFSNILYHKSLKMLKLIDVKGAINEEELYTNYYYDFAKLSHSICGRYDFFNSNQYQILLNNNSKFELSINFNNKPYIQVFKKYLNELGIDFNLVRILEASLFLSMLPLHIDYPQKVFGFILNAINILDEVENE